MSRSRREFLREAALGLIPIAAVEPAIQGSSGLQQKPAAPTAGDTLAIPVGRPTGQLGPLDNDPGVIAIERRLRCSCGCTLDVYTCRTTDFSCTYSPAMHAKVVTQVQQGRSADDIIAWFVAQPDSVYGGQKVLMAPPARGFNLMGYLVPGLTVMAFGLVLAAWLVRRRPVGGVAIAVGPEGPGTAGASPAAADLERLQRALDDVES